MNHLHVMTAMVLALVISLSGCAPSPDPDFFILSPLQTNDSLAGAAKDKALPLVVGPISLPTYLDRQQIVIRKKGQRLDIREQDRWAEPLATGVSRLLCTDLALLLASPAVQESQHGGLPRGPYLRLIMELEELDMLAGGGGRLTGRYRVQDQRGKVLINRRSAIERAGKRNMKSQVATLSSLVNQLSQEIAQEIQALPASSSP